MSREVNLGAPLETDKEDEELATGLPLLSSLADANSQVLCKRDSCLKTLHQTVYSYFWIFSPRLWQCFVASYTGPHSTEVKGILTGG